MKIETRKLEPFGLELHIPQKIAWDALQPQQLLKWLSEHRVLVVRGLQPLDSTELVEAAKSFGPIQYWSFGAINHLRVSEDAKNYLFTNREVPLHWDGAFAEECPHILFFQCLETSEETGGETYFVDTTSVLKAATPQQIGRWSKQSYQYTTEAIAHYGGSFTAPLVQRAPKSGEPILRFAEPVNDLNPVEVKPVSDDVDEGRQVMETLSKRLHRSEYKLTHRWKTGDIVIADNDLLLHGRNAFTDSATRYIQRVNILREKQPSQKAQVSPPDSNVQNGHAQPAPRSHQHIYR